ncbi:MAG: DUF3017 domain-containing protein [Cellulomonas sp.]
MVEERVSGGAGVRRAGSAHPDAVDAPPVPVAPEPGLVTPSPAAEAAPPVAPVVQPAAPASDEPPVAVPDGAVPAAAGPIPVEQAPLDPRAIARASLDAARNASLWWTSSGIVVATVVALVVGTRAGAFVLAAVALVCAAVRAVLPSPGPVALSVRAKVIDVGVLVLLGVGLALLAQILPSG